MTKALKLAVALIGTFTLVGGSAGRAEQGGTPALDTAAIQKALGRAGQQTGDVYRVTFPRSDLDVSVAGVNVKPGLALGTWAAFKPTGTDAVVHGDLVLTDDEVNPVISKLQAEGIEITAVHNHVLHETPHVMYVHYWGRGDAARLAASVKTALAASKTPLAAPAPPPAAGPDDEMPAAEAIQQALGRKGTVTRGVLAVSVPRPERITMMGVDMPPAMGMATALNFQMAAGGKVAGTGDFVMVGDEVNKVARALRSNGIEVTALHNHMIHGSPELYFMHFWALDTPAHVGAGLKAAIDVLAK